ncbi:MAG: ATP-binding cassette domain-containing protein [Alphaproteobacteria bacterium]|nr:ATP-binding cassette domain-containing protein [Alphaproteobacteria bacterium]
MTSHLHSFYQILRQHIFPWWMSKEKITAWVGLISLIGMSIFSVYMAVLMNEWNRDFFDAIENKNMDDFLRQVLVFIPLMIILIMDFCSRSYLSSWLSFRWRRWATNDLQTRWITDKNFYKIPLKTRELDNPDQRIAQDIQSVSYTSIDLFMAFFKEGINFVTFSIILWGLSSGLDFTIGGNSIAIPGLLVWAAFAYSLFGTIIMFKVGGPLIALDRIQEKREANFRYSLMRIFEHREEIATLGGEIVEDKNLKNSFKALTRNYYDILKRIIFVNLFQNFYMNVTMFIPLFLVGPLYFKGAMTMGVLMQIRDIFDRVNMSMSIIVLQYSQIASLTASLQRLIGFHNLMETSPPSAPNSSAVLLERITVPSLTISSPEGKPIWTSPSFELKTGDRKILMGPSGTGKTSLLRVLSGIYSYVDKEDITVKGNALFMPQRPYMPIGTFRDACAYPNLTASDDDLLPLLRLCDLEHLTPVLDEIQDYQNILSGGEKQRINFVRALLSKPTWLFMDEPVAHLDKDYTESLITLLTQNLPHTGIFIVSHQEINGFERV